MKKKLGILYILTGLLIFASCEKIIETKPQNSVTPEVALSDVSGYQSVLISVYDRLQAYGYWGRDMALLGDALSDNIFTVVAQAGGRYTTANTNNRGAHYGIWTNAYGAINELNTIIAGIDGVANVPASQKLLQQQVKSEALTLRGMIYFDLARVYGYEPNKIPTTGLGTGFDRSVVLRLVPTTLAENANQQKRASITETYTQIETDLKAGIAGFTTLSGMTGYSKPVNPYRITQSFAHALLGKVYLYWEKYPQAVTEFDNALNASIVVAKMTTVGAYQGDFKKVPHPESLFELNYVQSVEVAGVTGSNDAPFTYTQPTGLNAANVNTFAGQTVSNELLALFEAADDRRAVIFNSRTSTSGATAYNWANKYNGSNGPFTDNIKVLRYSDVLLMKAEALAMQTQYAAAAAIVTSLRSARNASIVGVPVTSAIINYIQDERRRELFFEGTRWFDLKRLGNGVTKPAVTAIATIPATDYRILAGIPAGEITLNPALPQNPNY